MKVDLSTVLMILVAISPGLFALRARDRIIPHAFRSKGATEELAEFVTLSLTVNLTTRLLESSLAKRFGLKGALGEDAFIYDLLRDETTDDHIRKVVFVEAEMKSSAGFYSGQVRSFGIVRDEEAHRPIYLTQAFYKPARTDAYAPIDSDGVLLDLADVVVLSVSKVEAELPNQLPSPLTSEEVSAETIT